MDKREVGNRLRIFIKEKFGTYEKGAYALNMKPPSLQTYLRGESLPGAVIISKLKELGCDTDWLLLQRESPLSENQEFKNITDKKIILSQAEEITMLKEQVKNLEKIISELEKDTERLTKEVEIRRGDKN